MVKGLSNRSGFEHLRHINRDYPSGSKTPTSSSYPPSHHSHRLGAAKLPVCRRLLLALKETVPEADAKSTRAMYRLSGYMVWELEQCQPL